MTDLDAMHGTWQPRYQPVIEAAAAAIADAPPGGAALAVWVDGEPVLDVWGGLARPTEGRPWQRDTLAVGFSVAKGVLATCALRAAQEGLLDLDEPCAAYWPAFAAHGKGDITARMVLAHRAGLPALDAEFTLDQALDGSAIVTALEQQTPLWTPDTGYAYHAMTYGWLVAEIIRRASGRPLAEHLARITDTPSNDTWLGLPEDGSSRLAEAAWDPEHTDLRYPPDHPDTPWQQRTITRSVTLGDAFSPALVGPGTGLNDPRVLRAGVPAVGIVSTARSMAALWARTITSTDGQQPVLNAEFVAEAARCRSEGETALNTPGAGRWAAGHMVRSTLAPMLSDNSFGHDGAGGQLCFADPAAGIGFAFLTNVLRNTHDDRSSRIVSALRDCLDADISNDIFLGVTGS